MTDQLEEITKNCTAAIQRTVADAHKRLQN